MIVIDSVLQIYETNAIPIDIECESKLIIITK